VHHRECCSMSRKAKSSFSAWLLLLDPGTHARRAKSVRTAYERIGTTISSMTRTVHLLLTAYQPTVTTLPCVFLLPVAFEHRLIDWWCRGPRRDLCNKHTLSCHARMSLASPNLHSHRTGTSDAFSSPSRFAVQRHQHSPKRIHRVVSFRGWRGGVR